MHLDNKITIVTGGTAGTGKTTLIKFVEEGATLCFCDVNKKAPPETANELESVFSVVDVSNLQAVQDWVDKVIERFERVDILINNAGILRDGLLG
jgi:3-oxoacyl-[acyl-carrier protein] reductase